MDLVFLTRDLPARRGASLSRRRPTCARPTWIREALRAALRSAESPAGFLLSLSGDAWAVCCVADQWLLKMRSIFKDVCIRVCDGRSVFVCGCKCKCVCECVRPCALLCVCVGVCVSACLCPEKGPRAPPPRRGGKGQVGMRFGASSKGF